MKKFQITVNGNTYEVEVEELQGGQTAAPSSAPSVAAAPAPAKKAAPKKTASAPAGATKVTAPMPGKIVDIKVSEGQNVKEGDVVAILEAMKMENEVIAPASGSIASINVAKGASVDSGDVIVSIQ